MKVCLKLSTYQGLVGGATHFYGLLEEYDDAEADRVQVTHRITAEQAEVFNKAENLDPCSLGAYKAHDESERFNDKADVIEAALAQAVEIWGEDVEVYRGNRCMVIEDMERLR